jgi:DNA modification methylase
MLATLPKASVQCCITSPPYWGQRNYQVENQLGMEPTFEEYVSKLVSVFHELWRVLDDTGCFWLNLGDCFATAAMKWGGSQGNIPCKQNTNRGSQRRHKVTLPDGVKYKDLIGLPFRVAFALQSDGWYLRQWMPWVKRNPMPESVQDRPASSCEIIFLLTKQPDYYYDSAAVRKPPNEALLKQIAEGYGGSATKDFIGVGVQDASSTKSRIIEGMRKRVDKQRGHSRKHKGFNDRWDQMTKEEQMICGSSRKNGDWFFDSLKGMLTDESGDPLAFVVNPAPFKESHFATFPPALIRPMILAGSRPGDIILDCFGGSGTTAMVATELGRNAISIDLSPEYVEMQKRRTAVTPGLALA